MDIREHHLDVEVSADKIIEEGCSMLILIEMTLEEKILEDCTIVEAKIL